MVYVSSQALLNFTIDRTQRSGKASETLVRKSSDHVSNNSWCTVGYASQRIH